MAKSKKKKLFLVTGATGFVGSHVVRSTLDAGHSVRALVRATSDTSDLERMKGVSLFVGDLTDPFSLEGVCDGVDGVLHTACAVAGTFDSGADTVRKFLSVNRDGSLHLAREVLKHKGLRLVHLSSTAAMGTPVNARVDEDSPCYPQTPYQISKREAELALLRLHQNTGLDVVILRPCVIAGAGKSGGDLLKLFKLVKKGVFPFIGPRYDTRKPMIMVDDVVAAMLAASERGRSGEIYFVHSGGEYTMGEIVKTAGEILGVSRTHIPIPIPLAKAMAYGLKPITWIRPSWTAALTPERVDLFVADQQIDISKTREELGYEPTVQSLRDMLEPTYEWHHARGEV
ncbi:MAG: NAD-dependent epimerase/dehydratase family protein [Myxococcales bacterium]|nr:NAD-dependent epimerase/dehydratase family protein [Myxococcales bacterium]